MGFFRFLMAQILVAVPTLFFIITISFFLMRVAPGGPFDGERPLSPAIRANLEAEYHLDKPVITQYFIYMKDLFTRGSLGASMTIRDYDVNELIVVSFPPSIRLGLIALAFAAILGTALGTQAALRHNSWLDYVVMAFSTIGIVVPNFVIAPILILIFAVILHWLPAGGYGAGWISFILPTISLSLATLATVARIMRGSMIETLNSNYIRMARAKGMSTRIVAYRHAFRAAILPVVSFLGPATAALLTGGVVVETIYGLPGIGRYFVHAALGRDYTLVLGVTIVYSATLLFMNLVVDVLYGLLDPKIRVRK